MSPSEVITACAQLSSPRVAELASRAVLVVPIGATEQHGPHLPVGVDAMVAELVASRTAARMWSEEAPVLVAPVLSFGSSDHHLPLAGTFSLASATLYDVLMDLLNSAVRSGFQRFLILNGHGGNDDIARQVARDITTSQPVVAAAAGYWSLDRPGLESLAARHGIDVVPGHAGAFETALVQAVWPQLVSQDLPPRGSDSNTGRLLGEVVIERHAWVRRLPGAHTDTPAAASPEAGSELLDFAVMRCCELVLDLFGCEVEA